MDVRNLTAPQMEKFEAGLCQSHERDVSFELLKLNGDPAGRLGLRLLAGSQVSGSMGGPDEVSRVLTCRALDLKRNLNFSPTSPGESLFYNRMVRVWDNRYIPGLGWVETAVFTGPVWGFKRKGNEIEFTCHSKERLAMGALWQPMVIKKGRRRISAVRELLERTGETFFDFPSTDAAMPERKALDRFASNWAHAVRLAPPGRQLYYDGWGWCRIRPMPARTKFVFRDGDGGSLMGEPEVSRTLEGVRNTYLILGKKPKGNRPRAKAVVSMNAGDAFSARELGRGSSLRRLAEKIEDSSLRTDKECRELGEQLMADAVRSSIDASFDALPIPHLDPGDLCRLATRQGDVTFRLKEFALPLVGGNMSVGQIRRAGGRK